MNTIRSIYPILLNDVQCPKQKRNAKNIAHQKIVVHTAQVAVNYEEYITDNELIDVRHKFNSDMTTSLLCCLYVQ